MRAMFRTWIIASAFLLLACGTPMSGSDAGGSDAGGPDAGGDVDAGTRCEAACADQVVVDPAWLAEHLSDTNIQIVDTRSAGEHESSRIPGAIFLDPNSLRATVGGVPGQLAPTADLQAAFQSAGLLADHIAVVYGADTGTGPARVFWTLEVAGHTALFLDGGFSRWTSEGMSTENGAVTPTPSDYAISATVDMLRVDADWVRDNLADPVVNLIDARSDGEFTGGHIASATSVDWTRNVSGGALLPRADVEALYTGFATDTTTMVTYCQTGSRASVSYVVLRWLGYADVRLYDGSWAEWSTLDSATYPRE